MATSDKRPKTPTESKTKLPILGTNNNPQTKIKLKL